MTMAERVAGEPLVSVIVPVFNGERHLDDCIRTILAQRHPALDVIVVDDGSTDDSAEICDVWAERDPRVRVLHTVNGGLSRARNRGIEVARGEYVTFVDADDVVAPDHVADLVEVARESGVELVNTTLVQFDDGGPAPQFHSGVCARVVSSDDALLEIVRRGVGFESCGKLMTARVMSSIRFTPGADFEDLEILPRLFAGVTAVAFSNAATYGYRRHPGSLMGGHNRVLRISLLDVLSSNIAFAATRHGSDSPAARRLTVAYALHGARVLEGAARAGVRREHGFDEAYRTFVARYLPVVLRTRELSVLYRFALVVSRVSPGTFTAGFGVARSLKATVAPNLRRASRTA